MRITLADAGKRFNRDWIFRHFSQEFSSDTAYAVTGPNGSGKSTLLQVIAGALVPSEGRVVYADTRPEDVFRRVAICAPYLELIEEMTAVEFLHFHASFKALTERAPAILEACGLAAAAGKQIRYFSSGMKQRMKLAQAFYSDTPVLLLDEPCTNLDAAGIALYRELIARRTTSRVVIVASNDPQEYDFASVILKVAKEPASRSQNSIR